MRITSIVAGGMLAITSVTATGLTTAHAALSECASNHMCAWGNNDFLWKIKDRTHGSSTWSGFPGETNDQMDSWANRSATYVGCMSDNFDGSGDRQTMAKNSTDNNVAPWNSDEVSAMRTSGGC